MVDIFGGLLISNIFGVLEIADIFGAEEQMLGPSLRMKKYMRAPPPLELYTGFYAYSISSIISCTGLFMLSTCCWEHTCTTVAYAYLITFHKTRNSCEEKKTSFIS